jgi:pimeloyl-ACP methyl ester carboxylesterase
MDSKLCEYWRQAYSWREQVKMLARFNHYRFHSRSGRIHFIHERGKGKDPIALVLTHGWPSSFIEMLKVIPMLVDPEQYGGDPQDSFDVIVPSLPGYDFSDAPTEPGMSTIRMAELWADLMQELRYERFAAQGGDWGAYVTTLLGLRWPDRVLGVHLSSIPPFQVGRDGTNLSKAEQAFLSEVNRWNEESGAYDHIQTNEPQTLAFGLNDSPIGLAAWMIDKFRRWSDCGGDLEQTFDPTPENWTI